MPSCGGAEWNPISIMLKYDQSTQSHRMVLREEAEELFEAATVKMLWGERARTREIVGILNRLNRLGRGDAQVTVYLGTSRSTVSRWRHGRSTTSSAGRP